MEGNLLFPVFLRLDKLKILVVGGGAIGLEKVSAIFKNSPNANVTLVAPEIFNEIRELALEYQQNLRLLQKPYHKEDLQGVDIVVAATSIRSLNEQVYLDAKEAGVMINVADTPDKCDFYMCSIVKKGDLKIGISSNGKSPTMTKRIREMLEEVLPEELDTLLQQLNDIRDNLKGDFEYKVKRMDEITSAFRPENKNDKHS